MTPPPSKKYLDSDFSGLILGIPPKELPAAPVSLTGVDFPKPSGDAKDFYSTALTDGTLKGYLDGAQNDPVAYLEEWRKNWWETDPEKYRKNHMGRDYFLTAAFMLYRQSKKPDEKAKLLNIFIQAAKGSFDTIQELKKDNSIHYMSDGYRRLSLTTGAMLGELKDEKTGEEAQTQLLTLLRDASQFVSNSIPTESNEYRHVRLYAQARSLLLNLGLTPPAPGESRKKLTELNTLLQGAKEAAEKVDAAYLKGEFAPLIDADLNLLPKRGPDLPLAREFVARQTANFVMMMASEIDLTDGDSLEKVQERYKALTQGLESVFSKNPTSTFKEALEKVSSPEAVHLKNLIDKNSALQDLRKTEELAQLQGTDNLKAADYAAKWSSAVLDVVEHQTGFNLGGAKNLASFREILNQFIKSSGGTAPSPFSQQLQDFAGISPSTADEASTRATKRFFEIDSSGFKISNGFGRFLSMENLLFIGAAGAMNRIGSTLLIRRAGAEGALGALVKEGQLTGWGHFAVGTGVGGVLSLGFAGTQYFKDLSADRPDAGANFFRNFAMGLVINTAALGLSFAGSAVLRNRMLAQEAKLLQASPPPSAGRLFFNRSVVPYAANLAIGSGGMLATNGIFRMYHNASHPGQQVPLVTLDEAVETTLTMAALPLAERPMHRLMMNKQLGEYRLQKISGIADKMMTERYGDAGSPSPYGTDRNLQPHVWQSEKSRLIKELSLQAIRGVEIKHLENPAFQARIAEKLKMPNLPALGTGTGAPLAQTILTPPPPPALPPSGLPDGVYRTENNKAVKFTPRSQIQMGQSLNAKVEKVETHPSEAGMSVVSIRHHDGKNPAGELLKVFIPTAELAPFAPNAEGHVKLEAAPALPPPLPPPAQPPPRTPSGQIPLLTTLEGAKIQLGRKMVGGMNPAGGAPLAPTRNAGNLYGKVVSAEYEPHAEGDLKVTLQLEQLNEPGLPQHILRLDPKTARTMEVQKDAFFPILNYEPPAGGEALPRLKPAPVVAEPAARVITPPAAGVFPTTSGEEYYLKKRPDHEPVLPGFIYGKVTEIIPAPQLQDPNSLATVTLTRTDMASGRMGNDTYVFRIPQKQSVDIGVESNAVFAMKRFYVDDITPPRGIPALTRPGDAWPVEQGVFLGIGDNMAGSPRRHKVKMVFPGVGEAAGFTHEGIDKKMWDDFGNLIPGYSPVNEDAFGMDSKNRVIVVADGMGGMGNGDQASHHGVKTIIDFMQQPGTNLGDAFLAGHNAIQIKAREHAALTGTRASGACVAAGFQIMPDGTVKTAIAGDARLWVLRPQQDGSYQVIEPYLPDTFATVERLFPAASMAERLQRKQLYESQMGVPLEDRDVSVDNTLSMNASQLNARVRSGLGHLGTIQPKLVTDLDYRFGNFGQILNTTVMVADPANPAGGKTPLQLQPGDVLLLMSDGVADLFNRSQMADTVNRKTDVEVMARSIELATLANLNYFQNLAQGVPPGQRVAMIDGRFIDARGDIYKTSDLNDTDLIGHVGPDNITATLFRYAPDVAAQEPVPPSRPAPNVSEASQSSAAAQPGASQSDFLFEDVTRQIGAQSSVAPQPETSQPKPLFDDPTGQYGASDLDPGKLFEDAERIEPSRVAPNPTAGDGSTTVVNRNFYQQASELFQRIKAQIETDPNLSASDRFVVLKLQHDSEGALVRKGIDYHTAAPTCAPDQAVLEIKTEASGARTILLTEEAFTGLMPQVKQALEETFAVQLTNAHVVKKAANNGGGQTRTEGSGPRTIPPDPGDTTTQQKRPDLQVKEIFQNRLNDYFTQLDRGQNPRGKLQITMKDKKFHISWQPADGLTKKVGDIPAMSRHTLTVEINGDVRRDPNAYRVEWSKEVDPKSNVAQLFQKALLDVGFQPQQN